jgi:hypothetical protein
MTNLDITILNDGSPYQYHQGAYKRNTFMLTTNNNTTDVNIAENNDLMILSPETENSYIQQNLPVRRQSLIVYHDRMRCRDEEEQKKKAPKRHSSLYILSTSDSNNRSFFNARLSNSKSLNSVHALTFTKSPPSQQQLRALPPLRIQITRHNSSNEDCCIDNSNSNSSSGNSSSHTEFSSMSTLYEDSSSSSSSTQQKQRQTPTTPTKFIGNL